VLALASFATASIPERPVRPAILPVFAAPAIIIAEGGMLRRRIVMANPMEY
jgi:hypothetical protein